MRVLVIGTGGQLARSLRDALIELVGGPLLLAQEPCLLQSDRGLIGRDAQNEILGLSRKINAPRPCDEDAELALQPEPQGRDRELAAFDGDPSLCRPLLLVVSKPAVEQLADLARLGG